MCGMTNTTGSKAMEITLRSTVKQLDSVTEQLTAALRREKALREALVDAYHELNEICARDGRPYCYDGRPSDVSVEYFAEVVQKCRAALAAEQEPKNG